MLIDEKEVFIQEAQEGDTLFSICSYVAENEDALNLVEGEKVYIIGKPQFFIFLNTALQFLLSVKIKKYHNIEKIWLH